MFFYYSMALFLRIFHSRITLLGRQPDSKLLIPEVLPLAGRLPAKDFLRKECLP